MTAARRDKGVELARYFFGIILIFGMITLGINIELAKPFLEASVLESYLTKHFVASSSSNTQARTPPFEETSSGRTSEEKGPVSASVPAATTKKISKLAGLSCAKYGGPSDNAAQEMVYWKDIPTDNLHMSPYKKPDVTQYLTFEPDAGGWNNIRMALETVIGLAFAMGRTLVLPPEDRMYLLNKGSDKKGQKQRDAFSFNHFFAMEEIHEEHPGLDIISMQEFLERVAVPGQLKDKDGKVVFPPGNRTNWDGETAPIKSWLREVGRVVIWEPDDCLAVFPASDSHKDIQVLQELNTVITSNPPKWEDYIGKPVPVDASTIERFKENWADRKQICLYDEELQSAQLLHFPVDHKQDARLLVHSYAFLAFQDWNHDLWMKRFIRDHVRYVDEIQCAAARVVEAVRNHARKRDPTNNPKGLFDTIHVRRGDFQYKATRVSADEIYEMTKKVFAENATVFIATDERDKSFFNVLKSHYDVVFLDDFLDVLHEVNTNYYGMIDQLVSSRGRFFFGCWFSTFTGYINRLRGYHATNDKIPGYEDGLIDSWYYVYPDRFDHHRVYYPVKKSFYAREFPTSWRQIDHGLEEFHKSLSSVV